MGTLQGNINEQQAESAFSTQSAVFDESYSANTIINYKRQRVRSHVLNLLKPCSSILELNSGTGDDALFFARQGYYVHATDISSGMQEQLKKKVVAHGMTDLVSTEICSYTQLNQLENQGPYDHIFSNFAGLNCTDGLDKVLALFKTLVKPGGAVTLIILPEFCLWETLMLFKGKFRTAFRRFFAAKGANAHIEGVYFKCWYYNPSFVIRHLKDNFDIVGLEGLCSIVPPSYIEGFAEKYPKAYNFLKSKEDQLKTSWPWKYIGDYYIISFRKK